MGPPSSYHPQLSALVLVTIMIGGVVPSFGRQELEGHNFLVTAARFSRVKLKMVPSQTHLLVCRRDATITASKRVLGNSTEVI